MWAPDKIVEGIEALENLPIDEFAEQFRDFYDILLDPDVAKEKYSFTGNVIFVTKAYCYNEQLEITHVNSEVGVTYRQNGETNTVGGSTDCPSDTTKMVPCLPS
ncbi:hypothetical protein I7X12_05610 [Halosimplex litoreum]|uniref:Uncharacterized protein n=1 Tax=Halosimplex litoreum TaxID=1198301 RepID=A0A7T3G0R8_9EURY|nr:hypothetical protein [Halosimplex litoreum]QPV64102.1 hypothetical protein I7X12_05610 [Halosimplex litoreum]